VKGNPCSHFSCGIFVIWTIDDLLRYPTRCFNGLTIVKSASEKVFIIRKRKHWKIILVPEQFGKIGPCVCVCVIIKM
ncbi:hypothetical protein, partial [Herbidospora sp. RD11066]